MSTGGVDLARDPPAVIVKLYETSFPNSLLSRSQKGDKTADLSCPPDHVGLLNHHSTRQHILCHGERSVSSPPVQNFPDKLQLLRGINRWFELHLIQLFPSSPGVDDPLHLILEKFELVFHLPFLRLQVIRFRGLPDGLEPRLKLRPLALELIANIPRRTVNIRNTICIHACVIRESVKRPAGVAPGIVDPLAEAVYSLTETALRPGFRDMISHRLHPRDLLEQPVKFFVWEVIQCRIQSQPSKRVLSLSGCPVGIASVPSRSIPDPVRECGRVEASVCPPSGSAADALR